MPADSLPDQDALRIAICRHPNGDGVWWETEESEPTCVQECDCTPKVYVAAELCERTHTRDLEAVLEADAERDRLRAENERYREAIKTALDTMAVADDEQMGPGGVARKAYAHLWHEYFAIPAGIKRSVALDEQEATS